MYGFEKALLPFCNALPQKQVILKTTNTAIRPCAPADLGAVLALATATEEIADFEGEAYDFFSRERLQIMAASPDVLFLVATAAGAFAGFFILLVHRAAGMAYIMDMALAAPYQRLGLGREMVGAGLDFAKKEGCTEVWCIVHEANEAAWRVFEAAGFKKGKRFFFVGKTL